MHMRGNFALRRQLPNRRLIFRAFFRIAATIFAGPYADDRKTLNQGHIDANIRNATGGKTDDQKPSVPANAAHAFIKHIAADRVVNHIRAAAGQLFYFFAKAVLNIQHGIGREFIFYRGEFFI